MSINEKKILTSGNFEKQLIVGKSECFTKVINLAKQVANSNASVLITGETGTGKEVIARAIHEFSNRNKMPFVAINCSAIPENLLESELFGHCRGAFTGAFEKKIGLFEEAEAGTLFLDEIGDMNIHLQSKLLRVLQEHEIKRIGENQIRKINVRIISATHQNLTVQVKENRFREDLYYRLNVIPISVPSLRERCEDILPLAEAFLIKYSEIFNPLVKTFSKEAIHYIQENQWRGNVRELENAIQRAVVLCTETEISLKNFLPQSLESTLVDKISDLSFGSNLFFLPNTKQLATLDEVIHKYIEFAVKRNGGARDRTAKEIGIDRKTLYKYLK